MEPKTKKGLMIGCGIGSVLVLLCCVLSIVLPAMFGEKLVKEGVPWMVKQAVLPDLPEGVDKERVSRLIDTTWEQVFPRFANNEINQREFEDFMNRDFTAAMQDEEVTPDEFDDLVDRFNEVVFLSEKDPARLKKLKDFYRAAKKDDVFSKEEINELLGLLENALASSAP